MGLLITITDTATPVQSITKMSTYDFSLINFIGRSDENWKSLSSAGNCPGHGFLSPLM